MLQYWESEGEFYTDSFVLCNYIESVTLCVVCGPHGTTLMYNIYIYIFHDSVTVDFRTGLTSLTTIRGIITNHISCRLA